MDWLNEYACWCKSLADNLTEINIETSDYASLANAVGGLFARCFVDKNDNLWITTAHPQACSRSRINAAIKEYNMSHNASVIEEEDSSLLARNFAALCFSFWSKVPISDFRLG